VVEWDYPSKDGRGRWCSGKCPGVFARSAVVFTEAGWLRSAAGRQGGVQRAAGECKCPESFLRGTEFRFRAGWWFGGAASCSLNESKREFAASDCRALFAYSLG
jgi:hypothetical protein